MRGLTTAGLLLLLAGCGSVQEPAEGPTPTTTTISYSGAPLGGNAAGSEASVTVTRFTDEGAVATPLEAAPLAVWRALHDAYAGLGLTATADSATLRAATPRLAAPRRLGGRPLSELVNCGFTPVGTPSADSYRVTLQLTSLVRPRAGGSQLETRLSASAREPSNGSSVECASTGALELQLAEQVRVRAGRQ